MADGWHNTRQSLPLPSWAHRPPGCYLSHVFTFLPGLILHELYTLRGISLLTSKISCRFYMSSQRTCSAHCTVFQHSYFIAVPSQDRYVKYFFAGKLAHRTTTTNCHVISNLQSQLSLKIVAETTTLTLSTLCMHTHAHMSRPQWAEDFSIRPKDPFCTWLDPVPMVPKMDIVKSQLSTYGIRTHDDKTTSNGRLWVSFMPFLGRPFLAWVIRHPTWKDHSSHVLLMCHCPAE